MPQRLIASSWVPMLLTALGYVVVLGRSVPLVDLGLFVGYVALAVALPGIYCWRLLLRRLHTGTDEPPTWFEDLSLGSIFGFGVQLPVYLFGLWIGLPLIVWLLPVLVLAVSATTLGRAVWALPNRRADPAMSWGLAAVISYGLVWLGRRSFAYRPLSLPGNQSPGVDETFHLALIGELSHRFPPEIPFLLGTRLDYHWFVHAQIATARWATGVDAQAMLRQLMPATLLTLAVLGLGAVALRLTGRPVAAFVAPALLVAGAFHLFGPLYPSATFTEPFLMRRFVTSPSQTYGVMMSMPAVMLLLEVLRPGQRAGRATWLALTLALLALSGSKATFMPMFLCGAIAVWVLQLLWRRRVDSTATALVVLLALVTAFAQLVLFGGSGGAMAFDPFGTVEAALRTQQLEDTAVSSTLMTWALLSGWLLYGVGAVGLTVRGRWRDPRAIWMLASIPAGVTVGLVFFRAGLSQLWFQRSAAELVVLVSAWGLVSLLPDPLPRRTAAGLLGVAVAAGAAAFAVSSGVEAANGDSRLATIGSLWLTVLAPVVLVALYVAIRALLTAIAARRRPGPALMLAVLLGLGLSNVFPLIDEIATERQQVPKWPVLFAAGGVDAAEYVEARSDPDDIVATNMHCKSPTARKCDNRHFWLSAYSERRVVIEGWGYTAPTAANFLADRRNSTIPNPYPRRLTVNDAAFTEPSARTVGALVDAYGVDWLFVAKKYDADVRALSELTGSVEQVFDNSHYAVFRVVG